MRTRDESKAEAIREKAIRMIVDKGFDGLSMQKLAAAAGVSPATIYIFYKNREDLLNSLFNDAQEKFAETALRDFDPSMSLEEGLWLQWKNRFDFIKEYPAYFKFMEQFRHSPLILHKDVRMTEFKKSMHRFVSNAVQHGQLVKMDPETFWALAYAPFYTLVKFHLQHRSMMNDSYELTEAKMKKVLSRTVLSLQP
jgi:TetR/AcrR family transcriptional repressor of multidrug resistance operon